jgi:hypothetical protein
LNTNHDLLCEVIRFKNEAPDLSDDDVELWGNDLFQRIELHLSITEPMLTFAHNPNPEYMLLGVPAILPNVSGSNDVECVAGYKEGRP